jgi:hypothetical protein
VEEKRVGYRHPIVEKAFDLARNEYRDPRLVDALRYLCTKIGSGKRVIVRAKAANGSGAHKVVAVTGVSVVGVKEGLDWLWVAGFPKYYYPQTHEFLALPVVDGAIMALLVAIGAWIARGTR